MFDSVSTHAQNLTNSGREVLRRVARGDCDDHEQCDALRGFFRRLDGLRRRLECGKRNDHQSRSDRFSQRRSATVFQGHASAGAATIINGASPFSSVGRSVGNTSFLGSATTENAQIFNNAATTAAGGGGLTEFYTGSARATRRSPAAAQPSPVRPRMAEPNSPDSPRARRRFSIKDDGERRQRWRRLFLQWRRRHRDVPTIPRHCLRRSAAIWKCRVSWAACRTLECVVENLARRSAVRTGARPSSAARRTRARARFTIATRRCRHQRRTTTFMNTARAGTRRS